MNLFMQHNEDKLWHSKKDLGSDIFGKQYAVHEPLELGPLQSRTRAPRFFG